MGRNLGFMQGRLSNLVNNKIQSFPWNNWENEFKIACENRFNLMEWTLDYEKLYENPLMSRVGKKKIYRLCQKYNLKIKSLTGDCFMQMPIWKNPDRKNYLKKCFEDVIINSSELGVEIIVVPLVDNSSLENKFQEIQLINFFKEILPLIKKRNIKIAFETDYKPEAAKKFICRFDNKYFGINYDIGNSAGLGFKCIDEMSKYGKNIFNVHVKDRSLNGNSVPLGKGNANFKDVFEYLRQINYKGNYILQTARSKNNNHISILNEYRYKVFSWMREK